MIKCKDTKPWTESEVLVLLIHAGDYIKKMYTEPENDELFTSYEYRQTWKVLDRCSDLLHAKMQFESILADLEVPGLGTCS